MSVSIEQEVNPSNLETRDFQTLGRGAKVSGAGVRTGGKGAGAPYSSARGQCRHGGSLEPPGRGAQIGRAHV